MCSPCGKVESSGAAWRVFVHREMLNINPLNPLSQGDLNNNSLNPSNPLNPLSQGDLNNNSPNPLRRGKRSTGAFPLSASVKKRGIKQLPLFVKACRVVTKRRLMAISFSLPCQGELSRVIEGLRGLQLGFRNFAD